MTRVIEESSVVDEEKSNLEIEITPIKTLAEFDVLMMLSIIEKNGTDEIEWLWLTNKLKMLVDGVPPADVFPRIGREVQKNQKTERDVMLAKKYAELKEQGFKKAVILEKLAESEAISESVVETAWKKWGIFLRKS